MSRTRRNGLRGRLSRSLVGVALSSVLLLSGVNFVFARLLIEDSVEAQLVAQRDTRIQAIERGLARLQSNLSTLAANPSVVDALVDLSAEYEQLDEDISPDQVAALEAIYESEVMPPFVDAGVDLGPTSDFVPATSAGRYVQQHYIADNPEGFDDRDELDDAGDGSGYSAAHAVHHPLLRELMQNALMSDLLLVDIDTLDVVYSTKKRIDLGTDAIDGPYGGTGLGEVLEDVSRVAVGDAVVSDTVFYLPTRGSPVFFLAAAVRSGSEVVGGVVTEVPVEAITAVTTAGQNWELLGMGDTGEVYVVGEDRRLRSDSRLWLEDPEDYLSRYVDRYDQQGADLIATVGSPVLLQEVDNDAVTAGLDGDQFIGSVTSYLGGKTLAAAAPLRFGNLDWVVIAEQARSETGSALNSYLRRILVLLAVLLPAIAALGVFLARGLTRPVNSLVTAADRIAGGDLDTEVEDLGRNELGDLGRQLQGVAQQLESQQQAIVAEEQNIIDILTAVLPARLVDRVRDGEQEIVDILDTATIISLTIDAIPEASGANQDVVLEITERINEEVDELMARFDIERVRRSSASQLFVAGLDHPDPLAADASRFALAAVEMAAEVGAEFGHPLRAHAGLSAGDVATGVLGSSQVAFGVWGDPPGIAVTLDSLAQPGQVLADGSVVERLGAEWDVGPTVELPGLADDVDAHVIGSAFDTAETH